MRRGLRVLPGAALGGVASRPTATSTTAIRSVPLTSTPAVALAQIAGEPTDSSTHRLQHIYGANKSAKAIAARLLAGGAKYGVLLTSGEGHLVSAGDVTRAISLVEAKIRADKAQNPLLLFYFAGHGISEGVGWNLFMVPGTFLYTGDLAGHDMESIAASTLPAAKLVDQLGHTGVRYVAVLDTCYEGKAANIDFGSSVWRSHRKPEERLERPSLHE